MLRQRTRILFIGFLLGLPVAAGAQAAQGYLPAGEGIPLFRSPGAVPVLAVSTGQWEAVPTDAHDMRGAYQYLPPLATQDTEGELFRLLESEDSQRVADEEGFFVVVPWTIGCGCADEGWPEPVWVASGDTVAFLLAPTRTRVPWTGPPVYDVLGWHQPYPVGDFIAYWGPGPIEEGRWLTPREFFALLQALPTEAGFELDPGPAFHAVGQWLVEDPSRAAAFPVPEIIQAWEGVVAGGAK